MLVLSWLLLLSGVYPLRLAWVGNRETSLRHTVGWAVASWAGWVTLMTVALGGGPESSLGTGRYLALCLTACAIVAVLGARRPGVGAWNFVLLGLLAVLLLPVAERLVTGHQPAGVVRTLFLCGTLAVGVLNYLPTRLGPAAVLLALGCAGELLVPSATGEMSQYLGDWDPWGWLALALVPWAGYLGWRRGPAPQSQFDCLWLEFRDRFGLLWGQRLREQFNRAAANAGWPAQLSWRGLLLTAGEVPDPNTRAALVETLRAMLRRFMVAGGMPV